MSKHTSSDELDTLLDMFLAEHEMGKISTPVLAGKIKVYIKTNYILKADVVEAIGKNEPFVKPTTKRRTYSEIARYARQGLKNEIRESLNLEGG